jgi:hypothetical protein
VRRMIVSWCTALVAMVPSLSALTRPPAESIELAIRNTPLLVARQNLLRARSRVVEHCYSDAVPPLLTTVEALAYFEAQEIGRYHGVGAEAGDIRQQIVDYTRGIEFNNTNAVSNIHAWLDQIGQWREHRMLSGGFGAKEKRNARNVTIFGESAGSLEKRNSR